METKVFKVVSQVLGVPADRLSGESSRETVEYWDSLKHIELILAIEEEFNILFTDEEITKMLNIGDMIEIIKGKGTSGC